ncbi:hypothetical protein EVAR_4330_1 [Eumeta japonica]|uniref:Uncharacterized protein n=1 Tax=Eumeta variegata TaxID=151549 RepID=A0A4C1VBM3_EUMVA|nr:hypothetical protein EVAR_4330_1 [Eumeta japonica]
MSHRTRESPPNALRLSHSTMIGLPRSTRELVHSLQMYCKLFIIEEHCACESPEYSWSPPLMHTCDSGGLISKLPASWAGIVYLMYLADGWQWATRALTHWTKREQSNPAHSGSNERLLTTRPPPRRFKSGTGRGIRRYRQIYRGLADARTRGGPPTPFRRQWAPRTAATMLRRIT